MDRKRDVLAYVNSAESRFLREDTVANQDFFRYTRSLNPENYTIGLCEYLDKRLRDEESYRIATMVILAGTALSKQRVDMYMQNMDNRQATRLEAMLATGLASQPDLEHGYDYYEIDMTKLAAYIRYMGFENPFEEMEEEKGTDG